jgi:hypothetical protein
MADGKRRERATLVLPSIDIDRAKVPWIGSRQQPLERVHKYRIVGLHHSHRTWTTI